MKKTISLVVNKEFKKLYNRGRTAADPFLVVYYLPNRQKFNRLGITVNKKFGTAVRRNRAKRLIREAYRLHEHALKTGYDMVIVARHRMKEASFSRVFLGLGELLSKSGLILTEKKE